MNASELGKRLGHQAELFVRKNGPSILTAVGVGGFIVSNVLTARATVKSADKIKEFKLKVQEIKSREDDKRAEDLGRVILKDGANILKDFAPAIAVGSVSIACVITSHGMMQKRQASLIAAYAALDRGFRAYRQRVAEQLGAEKEQELYRSPALLPCEGDEAVAKIDYSADLPSPYARFFDSTNPNWTKTGEYNLFFLRSIQTQCNDRLNARGFLFLNEVYNELGLPWSQAGQSVGWRIKQDEHDGRDGFIDFGLYDIKDEVSRAFVNGEEDSVLLDFNVDGPILI